MQVKIKSITVLYNYTGPDILFINFDNMIEGMWPYKANAFAKMEVAKGNGIEYAKKNFPSVELKIINYKTGNETGND